MYVRIIAFFKEVIMNVSTLAYGYPKMGQNRELKKAVESFWKGNLSREELIQKAQSVHFKRIHVQNEQNIDHIISNDFSLYDSMLDHSIMLGIVPDRYKNITDNLDTFFAMARGNKDAVACEMTKWFDTNYHYIVPELAGEPTLTRNTPLDMYMAIQESLSLNTTPYLIGPFTYIALSKT